MKDKVPDIRGLAAQLLGEYGAKAKAAVPALILALSDKAERAQYISADCVGLRPVRCDLAAALGEIGPEAAAALPALQSLLTEDRRGEVRVSAAMAMLKIDPQNGLSIPCLIAVLNNNFNGTGGPEDAAWALVELGPQAAKAIPALKIALKNKKYIIRISAARALAAVAGKDAVPALIARMKKEKTLGIAKPDRPNGEYNYNYNEHFSVRAAIIESLGELGPAAESAVPELSAALADPREEYFSREAAVEALGKIGPAAKSAVPLLRRLLEDSSESLRQSAREAMQKIEAAK